MGGGGAYYTWNTYNALVALFYRYSKLAVFVFFLRKFHHRLLRVPFLNPGDLCYPAKCADSSARGHMPIGEDSNLCHGLAAFFFHFTRTGTHSIITVNFCSSLAYISEQFPHKTLSYAHSNIVYISYIGFYRLHFYLTGASEVIRN